METVELQVEFRDAKGTRASRRYRKEGLLPANLYNGKVQQQVLLNYKDFLKAAEKTFTSQIFVLKSDKPEVNGARVVVKEVQKEFVKNKILHVDLYKLDDAQKVNVSVPLKIVGEAPGVKIEGGVLVEAARKITVKCLPANIPSQLEVDISNLAVGKRVKTGDLQMPTGVELRSDPKEVVVGVISGRAAAAAMAEPEPQAAAAAPAEGAEAESAAEGAPKAEADKADGKKAEAKK